MSSCVQGSDYMAKQCPTDSLTFCFWKECEDNDLTDLRVPEAVTDKSPTPAGRETKQKTGLDFGCPGSRSDAHARQPELGHCVLPGPTPQLDEFGCIIRASGLNGEGVAGQLVFCAA